MGATRTDSEAEERKEMVKYRTTTTEDNEADSDTKGGKGVGGHRWKAGNEAK